MRKCGALAIGGVLLISLATPVNAATPKAGATCTKKGATATSAGKIYTCMLSGKKLVWDKGVAIPKSNANPTSSQSSINNLLRTDSRITPSSSLTSLEVCKTIDKSPDYGANGITLYRNGFPRPVQSVSGKKSARILVIPMSFNDLVFEVEKTQHFSGSYTSDYEILTQVIPQVQDSFKQLSNNRFDLKIDVLPKPEWWIFNFDHPFGSQPGVTNIPRLIKLINQKESAFKFGNYDAYAFITSNKQPTQDVGFWEAIFAESYPSAPNGSFNGVLMIGGFRDPYLWIHELNHALYAFEDLYLQVKSEEISKLTDSGVPARWDLMAGQNRSLLNWNRFLMGWLFPEEVRCVTDQPTTIHYLADYTSATDAKLLTVNLAEGVTLAAEVRGGADGQKGLLIYSINSYTGHGNGPIITQNNLLTIGQKKSILGWDIQIIATNTQGVLFSLTKTDVNKFVPPKPNNSGQGGLPPVVDKNTNIDGQGCQRGEADVTNTFGKFVCTSLPDGNNLWKKQG